MADEGSALLQDEALDGVLLRHVTLGAGAVSGGLLALILLYAVWMLRRRQRGKLAAGLASSKPLAGVANSKRRASPGGRLFAQPGRALTLSRDLESSGPLSSV